MTKQALENAILYMICSYLDSELITENDIEDILTNVKRRAIAGI